MPGTVVVHGLREENSLLHCIQTGVSTGTPDGLQVLPRMVTAQRGGRMPVSCVQVWRVL